MNEPPAFGGGTFIADKSVWARADQEAIREEWQRALLGGQIVTCQITELELLYSARTGQEFLELEEELAALRNLPITEAICDIAIAALRQLAHVMPAYHRLPLPDALIAATALDAGIGVLHYDGDFDKLATVLDFESRWVAAAGTLD